MDSSNYARSGKPRLLRYAMGNMGKNALTSMIEVYGLFYFTEVLGVDPRIAGLVILVSLVWDALVDPLIGLWADKQLKRRLTVARIITFGMPLTALAFLGFFHLHLLPSPIRIASAAGLLIAFRAAFTLVDVPHNSLLVFAAQHTEDRTRLASLRILFSGLGRICLTAIAAVLLAHKAANAGDAMGQTAFAVALIFLCTLAVCVTSIRHLSPPLTDDTQSWKPILTLTRMFRNEPRLRLAFLLTAINSLTIPAVAVALIYGSKYQLGDTEIGATALILQASTQTIMPLVWERLSRRNTSATRLLAYAYGILLAVTLLACLLPISATSLYVLAAGSGGATAGIFMLNWAYFAEALAGAQANAETDMTLSVFGLYSIANKTCHGLAQAISGAILGSSLVQVMGENSNSANSMILLPLLTVVIAGAAAALVLAMRVNSQIPRSI